MATPIRILSCSQHTKYHICTHKHTHTNTHTVAPSALLFLPQQFHSVNVWLAAKPWPLAVLHLAGALILSFFLEPIQRLKWLPFSHGIVAFFPYPPVSALSCSLSINPFLSLSLSLSLFHLFFLLSFTEIPYATLLQAPFFYQLGFTEAHKSPCWCRITWCMYMHSSKACNTIAGYSFAHFTLIRALQYRQSVPYNLAVALFQFWD